MPVSILAYQYQYRIAEDCTGVSGAEWQSR